MKSLYKESKYRKQIDLAKKIQNHIEISYKIASKKIELNTFHNISEGNKEKLSHYQEIAKDTLQKKIDRHTNRQAYTNHKNDRLFSKTINRLYAKYSPYLDISDNEFRSSFSDNYQQRVYELIKAELLDKQFKLNRRPAYFQGSVDLDFTHNSIQYYLECTTRNSSLMDEYIKHLVDFDSHFKAAMILYNCRQQLTDMGERGWEASWKTMMEQLWYRLNIKDQIKIINLLKNNSSLEIRRASSTCIVPPKWMLEKLQNWVDLNWYALCYFRNLLPKILINKLKLILPRCGSDTKNFPRFLIESIVRMVIRKVKNPYFEKGIPVTLALSLSTLPDFMSIVPAFRNFEMMSKAIANEIKQNIHNYLDSSDDKNKIIKNLKSLYAIIIDTTWYNWLPDIAEQKHGARWGSDEIKNGYIILYNTDINLPHEQQIFSSVIKNSIDVSLL